MNYSPTKLRTLVVIALSVTIQWIFSQSAEDESDFPTYKTGFAAIKRLGTDLHRALKPKYQDVVHVQPIEMTDFDLPYVSPIEIPGEEANRPERSVHVSSGFVDLMNNVAHAKAIDKVEKGYFEKYLLQLSKETGEKTLTELPNLKDKRYWSEDMMNEQLSNFNQMVGIVVAIELSHHYLNHYQKYAERLKSSDNRPIPINSLMSPAEWEESMRIGTINALNCGFGIEGVKGLFEAIEKMPQRPSWTAYFFPADAQVKKVRKSLERIERDFFAGKTE